MWRRACFLTIFLVSGFWLRAQEIQNGLCYRFIDKPHHFRINYENDLLFRTDYYYTQGVHLEYVAPSFSKRRIFALFPRLPQRTTEHLKFKGEWVNGYLMTSIETIPESETVPVRQYSQCGIGLESAGYTPMSITADSILYGDRPFAGMAYVKLFAINYRMDDSHPARLSSTLSLGWMGPAAGGYEIQAYIHRHTGNPDPAGWKYQVGNSPIINYELNYEKPLGMPNRYFSLSGWAMARAGTLSTKAGVGIIVMAGIFRHPFYRQEPKPWQAYMYAYPEADLVGYDATLQGGPFTRDNSYTISSGDISRVTFRTRAGAVFSYKAFTLGISMRYLTREFRTGREHLTGGVDFAMGW